MAIGLDLRSKRGILPRSAARHMIAAEGLVAVGRMIDVYRRGHGATTDSNRLGDRGVAGSEAQGRCLGLGRSRAQ